MIKSVNFSSQSQNKSQLPITRRFFLTPFHIFRYTEKPMVLWVDPGPIKLEPEQYRVQEKIKKGKNLSEQTLDNLTRPDKKK